MSSTFGLHFSDVQGATSRRIGDGVAWVPDSSLSDPTAARVIHNIQIKSASKVDLRYTTLHTSRTDKKSSAVQQIYTRSLSVLAETMLSRLHTRLGARPSCDFFGPGSVVVVVVVVDVRFGAAV